MICLSQPSPSASMLSPDPETNTNTPQKLQEMQCFKVAASPGTTGAGPQATFQLLQVACTLHRRVGSNAVVRLLRNELDVVLRRTIRKQSALRLGIGIRL